MIQSLKMKKSYKNVKGLYEMLVDNSTNVITC